MVDSRYGFLQVATSKIYDIKYPINNTHCDNTVQLQLYVAESEVEMPVANS